MTQFNILSDRHTFGKMYTWSSYPAGNELCRNRTELRFSVRGFGHALFYLHIVIATVLQYNYIGEIQNATFYGGVTMKFIHISDLHLGKRVNEFSMLEDQEYILTKIINVIYTFFTSLFLANFRKICYILLCIILYII